MNALYEAVMIMGDSVEIAEKYGWECGHLGECAKSPKCANGIVTVAAGAPYPMYLNDMGEYEEFRHLGPSLRLIGLALLETAPKEILDEIERSFVANEANNPGGTERWRNPQNENLDVIGSWVASVNDALPITHDVQQIAFAWFRRAFDKLCAELPEPLPAEKPLTVSDILDAAVETLDKSGWKVTA